MTSEQQPYIPLKYGCNPHQKPSYLMMPDTSVLPFETLNGSPGYINLLDALNGWQLVSELDEALGLPAAASFKHVSPAGAAVGMELSSTLRQVYGVTKEYSPLALAYLRARNSDPMSSYGDFIALSRRVDFSTAQLIQPLVSDGIIAPDYEPAALALLKDKRKGKYLILKANSGYYPPEVEYREVYGVGLAQKRNSLKLSESNLLDRIVTSQQHLPLQAKRDLILAAITLKYTQSNSVGYALEGQMIGIGAGQQSRVDCTKLAGRKADLWFLRQHPKILEIPFKEMTSKVDRINAQIRFIEGDMAPAEAFQWNMMVETSPEPFTHDEQKEWLAQLDQVSLASDAFFPFVITSIMRQNTVFDSSCNLEEVSVIQRSLMPQMNIR